MCHKCGLSSGRTEIVSIVIRKLANKKVKDLPDLNLKSTENVYISEPLMPLKKLLFGKVIRQKKKLKWKHIWTHNGRIYSKGNENSTTRTFDMSYRIA